MELPLALNGDCVAKVEEASAKKEDRCCTKSGDCCQTEGVGMATATRSVAPPESSGANFAM